MSNLTSMPAMAKLQVDAALEDDDDEDDRDDSGRLLNILMKLKGAKAAFENSKKRKHTLQIKNDCMDKFRNDVKEAVAKYKRKVSTMKSGLNEKYKVLLSKISQEDNRLKGLVSTQNKIYGHVKAFDQIYLRLEEFKKSVEVSRDLTKNNLDKEAKNIKSQIITKVTELREYSDTVQKMRMKDDKINILIKSIVEEFLM